MRRKISSEMTGFHKFVAPAFMVFSWIGMAVYLSVVPTNFPIGFLVLVIVFSAFIVVPIFWLAFKLRHVSINEQFLYVEYGNTEEKIPLGHIAEVKQNNWIKPFPVTIRLAGFSDNPQKLLFIPQMRGLRGARNHPIVAELNQLRSGPPA